MVKFSVNPVSPRINSPSVEVLLEITRVNSVLTIQCKFKS